jgi:hypothetical protein
MRYHLLRDLAQRYCPDLLQQIEKKMKKKERGSRRLSNGSFLNIVNASNTESDNTPNDAKTSIQNDSKSKVLNSTPTKQNDQKGEGLESLEHSTESSLSNRNSTSNKKKSGPLMCFLCGPKKRR